MMFDDTSAKARMLRGGLLILAGLLGLGFAWAEPVAAQEASEPTSTSTTTTTTSPATTTTSTTTSTSTPATFTPSTDPTPAHSTSANSTSANSTSENTTTSIPATASPSSAAPTTAPTPATTEPRAAVLGAVQGACNPSYPTLCLPISGDTVNCGDPILGAQTDFPVGQPDTHGLDSDGDRVGCESGGEGGSGGSGVSSTGSGGSSAPTLPETGTSASLALALVAIGLVLLGGSAVTSNAGRQWYATSRADVRYTVDRVIRRSGH